MAEEKADDFLAEGYYDHVPLFTEIPDVDTTIFDRLSTAYQGEEFDYEHVREQRIGFFKKVFDRIGRWLGGLFPDGNYFKFSDLVYKILASLALVVLVWIIYRTIVSRQRLLSPDEEERAEADEIKFVERNLMDVDLPSYIAQAEKDQDFVKAIRYLNLLNIQLLARKGWIDWKHAKSHVELIAELTDETLKKEFAGTVHIFNRVWYGNTAIDAAQYGAFSSYFVNFQSKWA
ncbi:hypothetical protein GCM10017764_24230 [Sphingobacterium griseoflavum]|uniref:DUF4129 domain-containing protein n=2 Tax=Sphingobacterium griseoflavum TaxID=1474952 RepID=A0ABQ3HZQ7_9SPHI|nr:hypothetical protein GCM10017764_24230 [Sphingobacterium griseoflavum]